MKNFYFLLLSLFLLYFPSLLKSCSIPNCLQCSTNDSSTTTNMTCLHCVDGFYYSPEEELCRYILPCDEGEYKDSTDGQCHSCSPDCNTCSGPQSYDCTSCIKGYFALIGIAPWRVYEKCFTCLGQYCDECDEIGDCVSCPKGYWLNGTSGDCNACSQSNCDKCDSNINGCDNCKYGYIYSNSNISCILNSGCSLGYYYDYLLTPAASCQSCDSSCKNCYGPNNTQCYECGFGYYFDNTGVCLPCNSICVDCEYDAEFCTACQSPMLLRGQKCVINCAEDEYFDLIENKCKKCSPLCGRCQVKPDFCIECSDLVNYYLSNNTCLSICGANKYMRIPWNFQESYNDQVFAEFLYDNYTNISISNLKKSCGYCQPPCVNCILAPFQCTQCPSGQSLYNYECLKTCPPGTYQKFDLVSNMLICLHCSSGCKTCQNYSYCTQCESPLTYMNGKCYFNQTQVGDCESYQFLFIIACFDRCPIGTIVEGNQCNCDPTCADCYLNISDPTIVQCDKCLDRNDVSYHGVCQANCPNFTWLILDQTSHSQSQSNGGGGFFNLPPPPSQIYCYDTCPPGYLMSYINAARYCVTNCPAGTKNYQGTCIMTSCADGSYYNPQKTNNDPNQNYTIQEYLNYFCSSCDNSCKTCNGPAANNCLSCNNQQYLQNTQNLTSQEFTQLQSKHNLNDLINAMLNYYSTSGAICSNSCSAGFTNFNQICMICLQNCTVCAPPLMLFSNNCVFNCPDGTLYNQTTNNCDLVNYGYSIAINLENVDYVTNLTGFVNDLNAKLLIYNIIQISMLYPSVINISSLECSLQNLNDSSQNHNLFVRLYNFIFVKYDFYVPASYLTPDTQYNLVCNVLINNNANIIPLNTMIFFQTYGPPVGIMTVSPLTGISLKDHFTINCNDFTVKSLNLEYISLNYELSLFYNNKTVSLYQSYDSPTNVNFVFPYTNQSIEAMISLHVYNDYTESYVNQTINVLPFNQSQVNFTQIIDFSIVSLQNLNILINGFTEQNSDIQAKTTSNLINNEEFLYKNINNDYNYLCDPTQDCNNCGTCLTSITDPKQKCQCFDGFAGFDCSWNTPSLETTRNLFANTLDYIENQLNTKNSQFNVVNDIIQNMALFPDAYNYSMLNQTLVELNNSSVEIYTQNDTVNLIKTLNNLLNVLNVIKPTLTTNQLSLTTKSFKDILDMAISTISDTFAQSSLTALNITTPNINVSLTSLAFLSQSNNPIQNFTLSLGESTQGGVHSPSIKFYLGKQSSAILNYYGNNLFSKLVIWPSAIISINDANSRYFTNIFSVEIKNRSDYSNFTFDTDTSFVLDIPTIAIISTTSSSSVDPQNVYQCLFYDNDIKQWNNQGLMFSQTGNNYIECISSHLTEFSVQLTNNTNLIYNYFGCTNCLNDQNDQNDDDHHRHKLDDLGIIFGFHAFLSLLLVWVTCLLYKKNYVPVASTDQRFVNMNPVKIEIKEGKDGGTCVDQGLENAKNMEDATKNNSPSRPTSTKNSMIFASLTLDTSGTTHKTLTCWVFHPLYSIYINNDKISKHRKIMQLYFTLCILLFWIGFIDAISEFPVGIFGLVLSLIITWVSNYMFGYTLACIMASKTKYSNCAKISAIFFFYVILLIIILLAYNGVRDPIPVYLLEFVIVYFIDTVIYDSLVVMIVFCCPGFKRCFKIRGFGE